MGSQAKVKSGLVVVITFQVTTPKNPLVLNCISSSPTTRCDLTFFKEAEKEQQKLKNTRGKAGVGVENSSSYTISFESWSNATN